MIPLSDDIRPRRTPLVTIALILANVAAYVIAAVHGGSLIGGPSEGTIVGYGAIPYEFGHLGQHCALGFGLVKEAVLCAGRHGVTGSVGPAPATWVTAFTAMFLHAKVLHLAGNMFFLGVFGASVEDRIGHLAFLGFYLVGGLAALALAVFVSPASVIPTLCASGAIAAVLGAYVVLYPRARIRTLVVLIFRVTFIELPAWALAAAWVASDAILGAVGLSIPFGGGAGLAYYAHWGALAVGVLVARVIHRRQWDPAPSDQFVA